MYNPRCYRRCGSASALKITNVQVIQASEIDPHLPKDAVDLVLLVDVYHELAHPYEVMQAVRDALRYPVIATLESCGEN